MPPRPTPPLSRRHLLGFATAALVVAGAGQARATRVIRGFDSQAAVAAATPPRHRLIRIPPEGAPEPDTDPVQQTAPSASLDERLQGVSARTLRLHNANTNESLTTTYWQDGYDVVEEHARLAHFLRDWRQDAEKMIEPTTLDILYALQQSSGTTEPVQILSGYRTPATNALLARSGYHVAQHSLHLHARAIDFHIPGMRLGGLRDTAVALASGGVGYYPNNHFLHIDNGQVRTWVG